MPTNRPLPPQQCPSDARQRPARTGFAFGSSQRVNRSSGANSKSSTVRQPLTKGANPVPRRSSSYVANDQILLIVVDQRNGKEHYMSQIDAFIFRDTEYTVLYNYEFDNGEHKDPEVVIMRTYRDANGDQYFTSIRDKKELKLVFELFYERFARANQA